MDRPILLNIELGKKNNKYKFSYNDVIILDIIKINIILFIIINLISN